ncbi:hypothetical protein AAVH_13280 [Aphelenchoides avenae]|nr:hypothetical protein AAVH_13280 [Aphelenchus avenae]
MCGATNAITSALPAIQSEIDTICKDLHLSVDHLNHGDLSAMYAGLRDAVSGQQQRRLYASTWVFIQQCRNYRLALTPDTWAFGVTSTEPVRMDSTIVDAEGRRFAPEISLSSAQTLSQVTTATWSPAISMMMSGATPAHMTNAPNSAPAKKPRAQENMASSSMHMQPTQIRGDPLWGGQQNTGFMDYGPQPAGMMRSASQLQLAFNCPGLAEDCEVVCLATARLQDGDRFMSKSTFFVTFAGATPFSWEFASVPLNMAMAKPVCHVKLRLVPLSTADVVEKMDRLEELIGQEEYAWRLMSLKQEFAVKGIAPHPARR